MPGKERNVCSALWANTLKPLPERPLRSIAGISSVSAKRALQKHAAKDRFLPIVGAPGTAQSGRPRSDQRLHRSVSEPVIRASRSIVSAMSVFNAGQSRHSPGRSERDNLELRYIIIRAQAVRHSSRPTYVWRHFGVSSGDEDVAKICCRGGRSAGVSFTHK